MILRGVGLRAAPGYRDEGQNRTMVKADLSRLVDILR